MDLKVYPKSRIARLPRPLQPAAALVREVVKPVPKLPYVYESDGLATAHYTPFLEDDREFDRLYWEMEWYWQPSQTSDYRWRMWLLTRFARRAAGTDGDFAEFGTYRGGCALMILQTADLPPTTKFHLFDTFGGGIPDSQLTEYESESGFAGRYPDTSPEYVAGLLNRWASQVEIHAGDVFETLRDADLGSLSYVHLDLNASAPTKAALDYVYPRLVPGFTIVFDDWGWPGYRDQKQVIDEFFADKREEVVALPTGQGIVLGAGD